MLSKKRSLVFAALAIIGIGLTSLAFAGKQNQNQGLKGKAFTAMGEVKAIALSQDLAALSTMSLDITKANKILKPQIGQEFLFFISPDVKVKTEGAEPGIFDLTMGEVAPDDTVRVFGRYNAEAGYVVTRIVLFVEDAE
jgi:hypothetical protein